MPFLLSIQRRFKTQFFKPRPTHSRPRPRRSRPLTTTTTLVSRPFCRTTRVIRYQNVLVLDFIGARMMEVLVTTGAMRRAKLQSNRHHLQTNTQLFYRPDVLPVIRQTVSEEKVLQCTDYAHPKLTFQPCV